MRRFLKIFTVILLLLLSNLISICGQDSKYYTEFYKALNTLVRLKYSRISLILDKSWEVYRTSYGLDYPKEKIDVPPQPPPPGNIYYARWKFNYLVLSNKLDKKDIDYMYNSIDSTKIIILDPNRTSLHVIPYESVFKIFRNSEVDFKAADDSIQKLYGARKFIIVSTPIFNKDFTSLIITIKTHQENVPDETYVMHKKKWKLENC